MMKQVMKRAWELAKEGVTKFGGKVREYFATSLSIAWKEIKSMTNEIVLVGSEKQVKWAMDIRAKLLAKVEKMDELIANEKINLVENFNVDMNDPDEIEIWEEVTEIQNELKEMLSNTSAKFYIETLRYKSALTLYENMKAEKQNFGAQTLVNLALKRL